MLAGSSIRGIQLPQLAAGLAVVGGEEEAGAEEGGQEREGRGAAGGEVLDQASACGGAVGWVKASSGQRMRCEAPPKRRRVPSGVPSAARRPCQTAQPAPGPSIRK